MRQKKASRSVFCVLRSWEAERYVGERATQTHLSMAYKDRISVSSPEGAVLIQDPGRVPELRVSGLRQRSGGTGSGGGGSSETRRDAGCCALSTRDSREQEAVEDVTLAWGQRGLEGGPTPNKVSRWDRAGGPMQAWVAIELGHEPSLGPRTTNAAGVTPGTTQAGGRAAPGNHGQPGMCISVGARVRASAAQSSGRSRVTVTEPCKCLSVRGDRTRSGHG